MKSVVTTMALLAIVQASTNKTETLKTTIAPAKAAPASARNVLRLLQPQKLLLPYLFLLLRLRKYLIKKVTKRSLMRCQKK